MGPLVLKLVLLKLYLYVGQDFLFPSKLFFPFKKQQTTTTKKTTLLFPEIPVFLISCWPFQELFFFFPFP